MSLRSFPRNELLRCGTIHIFLAASLLCIALPADAVYKCVENGKTVYSDRPCPATSTTASAPDLTNSARGRNHGNRAALDTGPLPPIDFGNTPNNVVSKAGGIVSSILVDARDCDWALRVTKDTAKCAAFLQQMIEGREFTQSMQALADATPSATGGAAQSLRTIAREAEEILRIRDFAVHRINR